MEVGVHGKIRCFVVDLSDSGILDAKSDDTDIAIGHVIVLKICSCDSPLF